MAAAVLTMKSPLYQGPINRLLQGMDLSWVLGLAVAAATYAVMARGWPTQRAGRSAAA